MEAIALSVMDRIIPHLWISNNHNRGIANHYSGRMENEATLALADNVRRLMAHKDWTLVELAKRANVSKSALGYLVNYKDRNDRHPTTKSVEGIAEAFGLPVWQLMMPNLSTETLDSHRLTKLVENYLDAPEAGKAVVERSAQNEVRYAVAESALTGQKKTGKGSN